MSTPKPASKTAKSGAARKPAVGPLAPERVAEILQKLDEAYPEAVCALTHRTPWELLVATILSAQCTDVRVNMVTPELFRRFPTPAAMAKATLPELGRADSHDGILSQQGEVDSGRGKENHQTSLAARFRRRWRS